MHVDKAKRINVQQFYTLHYRRIYLVTTALTLYDSDVVLNSAHVPHRTTCSNKIT
jgi:hypothetical protein